MLIGNMMTCEGTVETLHYWRTRANEIDPCQVCHKPYRHRYANRRKYPTLCKSCAIKQASVDSGRTWTPEEIMKMRDLYPTHTFKEIAEVIGKSHWAVRRRIRCLKLQKEMLK